MSKHEDKIDKKFRGLDAHTVYMFIRTVKRNFGGTRGKYSYVSSVLNELMALYTKTNGRILPSHTRPPEAIVKERIEELLETDTDRKEGEKELMSVMYGLGLADERTHKKYKAMWNVRYGNKLYEQEQKERMYG